MLAWTGSPISQVQADEVRAALEPQPLLHSVVASVDNSVSRRPRDNSEYYSAQFTSNSRQVGPLRAALEAAVAAANAAA